MVRNCKGLDCKVNAVFHRIVYTNLDVLTMFKYKLRFERENFSQLISVNIGLPWLLFFSVHLLGLEKYFFPTLHFQSV